MGKYIRKIFIERLFLYLLLLILIDFLICNIYWYFYPNKYQLYNKSCLNNLKQLGLSLQLYASYYNGIFPPNDPFVLYPLYLSDKRIFICPGDNDEKVSSYEYIPGLTTSSPDIILKEKRDNHIPEGKFYRFWYKFRKKEHYNVLRGDGTVDTIYMKK